MSQNFKLILAIDNLDSDAQQLGVSCEQLQHIMVEVNIAMIEQPVPQLQFTYKIQLPCAALATKFDWPAWSQDQVSFTNYLWERTCLECFLSCHSADAITTNYIEINASPNGQYALYQFDAYRHPSYLPPKPLLAPDKMTLASLNWSAHPTDFQPNDDPIISIAEQSPIQNYHFDRRFSIDMDQLSHYWSANKVQQHPNQLDPDKTAQFILIHPCVILKFDVVSLYFANTHAIPPDFHQRAYWTYLSLSE